MFILNNGDRTQKGSHVWLGSRRLEGIVHLQTIGNLFKVTFVRTVSLFPVCVCLGQTTWLVFNGLALTMSRVDPRQPPHLPPPTPLLPLNLTSYTTTVRYFGAYFIIVKVKDGRWAHTEVPKMEQSGVGDVFGRLRAPWNVNARP